ncbi:MAG TPA: PEGA domain-containing protein [Chloroflexia bacterium]|nr:PEGA domain-containing protein [Chloroflexia bacterium]
MPGIVLPGLIGIFLLILKSGIFSTPAEPVALLALESEPAGVTVSLNGAWAGVTPVRVKLVEGHNHISLSRKDYGTYSLELTVSREKDSAASPAAGASDSANSTHQQEKVLPVYSYKAHLSLEMARLTPLTPDLPNYRIEYARFLPASPSLLEISEEVLDNQTLPAGTEGLSTGLWLYDISSHLSSPVVVGYPALKEILAFYGMPVTETAFSSNLARLILAAPTLSPDGSSLAVISQLTGGQEAVSASPGTALPAKNGLNPDQDGQVVWVLPVELKPGASGAVLAGGTGSRKPAVKNFSLADLPATVPGISPESNTTGNLPLQARLTLEGVDWNPAGDSLLVTAATSGQSNYSSSASGTLLLLSALKTGEVRLVTPQPLPAAILPGTVVWKNDSSEISFLVNEGASGTGEVGRCVLDILPAANATPAVNKESNPLHYLGRVAGKGAWPYAGMNESSYLTPGKIRLPRYAGTRYNSFAWLTSPTAQPAVASQLPGQPQGVYGAAAPGWASGQQQRDFNTLYSYLPVRTGLENSGTEPLTIQRPPKTNSGEQPSFPQDSFPFWINPHGANSLPELLYFSGQVKQSSGGFLGGNTYFEISLKELGPEAWESLPALSNLPLLPGESEPEQGENELKIVLLSAVKSPVVLPAFEDEGINQFEALFKPDGSGAILVLPGLKNSQAPRIWLVNW